MQLTVHNDHGLQWRISGPDTYQMCGRTIQQLPPGAYSCAVDNCWNALLQFRELNVDELIDFPGSLPNQILDEIERFWGQGARFKKLGFLHRRGYLFHGKQGCGKSSLIHMILSRIIAQGHVAFFCTIPNYFLRCMEQFRQVEPDRPIVCIFEDIDAIIRHHGDSELLQWLDGNHQVNKAVNLASTNYPEKLDRRIIARPRRFDCVLQIEAPDAQFREAFFARKLPELPAAELQCWVEVSAGLPFASLAELVISVCCLDHSLEKAAELLKELDQHHPSSEDQDQPPESNGETIPEEENIPY
jgi:hypothetical protein